ncbi:Hypothetical_protein [Hexamita inflata]|uniref:Hypothetical_protein n=1 Tax=Hexamita inflata TaxID=28002 RepID=A0AA86N4Q4_9EUKA|nr:Hypothetical protein HINF_LOCUS383 [Hexamita inflata]
MQRQLFSSIQSQYDLDAQVQSNFSYNKIQIVQKPQLYNSKLIQKVILQNQDIKTRGIKTHIPFNLQDISKSRSYTQIQEITILPNLEVRDNAIRSISPLKLKRQESRAVIRSLPFRKSSLRDLE